MEVGLSLPPVMADQFELCLFGASLVYQYRITDFYRFALLLMLMHLSLGPFQVGSYLPDVNFILTDSFLAFWLNGMSWTALTFLCRNEDEWVSPESQNYCIMCS